MKNFKFLLLGTIFGIILIKGEVISWFRIQEMFRFQSFHMYGTICSAIAVGMLSIFLIKKIKVKTFSGEEIIIEDKKFSKGNVIGGLMFGFGWALTGACPGPLYAIIGSGLPIFILALLSAVFGTFCYGLIREKLPN